MGKIITIHHVCPCRIKISHPRGRDFNQGQGLLSPWLNSDPEVEISLSYMDTGGGGGGNYLYMT